MRHQICRHLKYELSCYSTSSADDSEILTWKNNTTTDICAVECQYSYGTRSSWKTYFGIIVSSDGCTDAEIRKRMAKSSASFGGLFQNNHRSFTRVQGNSNLGPEQCTDQVKEIVARSDRAVLYWNSDQEQPAMDWTPFEPLNRQATKINGERQ